MPARESQLVSLVVFEDEVGAWTLRMFVGGEGVILTRPYETRAELLLAVASMFQSLNWDLDHKDEASDG